jgi:hypothetical protein
MSLIYDLPNSDYHGGEGTFSSSQLKAILEDPEIFYKKYVIKEIAKEELAAFDIGTYFHTAVLEPELMEKECAVFEGIRRGKAWDEFKEANAHKTIITKSEYAQARTLIDAVHASPVASNYLSRSKPEVSAFVTLTVYCGEVYCQGKILTIHGWKPTDFTPPPMATQITIKCRADALGDDFILDLKSTTGNVKNEHSMRSKVSSYSYDLSAAMYLDVFSIACERPIEQFLWTFASKDVGNCKTYMASKENIMVGRAKWKKAVCLIAHYIEQDWQFTDSLGVLEPNFYEKEWLQINEEGDL